jgi:hypothetical protein
MLGEGVRKVFDVMKSTRTEVRSRAREGDRRRSGVGGERCAGQIRLASSSRVTAPCLRSDAIAGSLGSDTSSSGSAFGSVANSQSGRARQSGGCHEGLRDRSRQGHAGEPIEASVPLPNECAPFKLDWCIAWVNIERLCKCPITQVRYHYPPETVPWSSHLKPIPRKPLPQHLLLHLPRAGMRQLGYEHHVVGQPPLRDPRC